ncbi:MAG: NAD(P)H-dependent oxidoreductase subunit E [Tepidiformaceae bacterium]
MTAEPELRELRELLAEFEPDRGHVMPALHKVQDKYGYIPKNAFDVIARQLNSSPALIYGAATFYTDFRMHAPAKTEVSWCCGPACRVLGGQLVVDAIQDELGIGFNEQTEGHAIGLHVGQCVGTCHEAPQVWVNGKVKGNLTPESARELVRELKEAAE